MHLHVFVHHLLTDSSCIIYRGVTIYVLVDKYYCRAIRDTPLDIGGGGGGGEKKYVLVRKLFGNSDAL